MEEAVGKKERFNIIKRAGDREQGYCMYTPTRNDKEVIEKRRDVTKHLKGVSHEIETG